MTNEGFQRVVLEQFSIISEEFKKLNSKVENLEDSVNAVNSRVGNLEDTINVVREQTAELIEFREETKNNFNKIENYIHELDTKNSVNRIEINAAENWRDIARLNSVK